MDNVNEKLLDAMSLLIENNNTKLRFDKTIKCQIVNADKAQSGEYRVKYFGDTFIAYSEDTTKIYKVNDNVFVRIPQNDMDNKKFITEKITNKNDYDTSLEEVEDIQKVDLIGISWDKIYNYPLNSCVDVLGQSNSKIIYQNTSLNYSPDSEFQKYSKGSTSFILKGTFTTNFTEIPEEGNWGLRVTFKYKTPTDGSNVKYRTSTYTIDHTSMTGNSYNYTNSSIQYAIFSVEGDFLIGIEKIELFQEGIKLKNGGSICVENLLLQYVTPIEDYSTYSVHILTKDGIFLNERNHRQITLEAQYKYKGQNILTKESMSNYSIYWFREDKRVGRFSEEYTKEGGIGWRKIDENKITIAINKQDVMTSARYKLVINYDDYWINKIVEVYYEDSTYSLDIVFSQDMQDLSIANLEVVINPTSNDYTYYWIKETIDGEIEELVDHNRILRFDITDIYLSTTFYCTIYKGDFLLGTVSKVVSTDVQESDLEVTFVGGNTTFLYDEAGDITLATAEEQRQLSFQLTWKNDKASQYSIEWILPPEEDTMLTGFIYNEDKTILYYKLRPKYNAERTNNTVSLIVRLNDGTEFEVKKEFLFLKQGNPGTNGTTFTTKIESNSDCLIFGDVTQNTMQLNIVAYKDGELASSLGYNIQTTWSIPNVYKKYSQIDVTSSGRVITTNNFGNQNYYGNIVKAATRISKGQESTTIYNYFPVMILRYYRNRNYRIVSRVKDILYSSDGYNPNYASTTPWKANIDPTQWSILGNTNASMYQTEDGWFLQAPKKYLASDGPLAVMAKNSNNDFIICPIVTTLNTYGLDWVNSWDGLTVDIDPDKGTILAPMIGAGEKHSDNSFSGTVMGVHSLANEQQYSGQRNGLVGYLKGQASYGFFADGQGFIGLADKGRISFDGSSGTITSGNYSSTEGMMIDMTNGVINSHDFRLETGTIYMNAIPNARLTNVAIGIHKLGGNEYTFRVLHNGSLFAANADIEGKIVAHEGRIGNVRIDDTGLYGGYIEGSHLHAGTITGGTMSATSISAGTMSGTVISGVTLEGENVNGGTIRGGYIYGSTITGGEINGAIINSGNVHITDSNILIGEGGIHWSGNAVRIHAGGSAWAVGNGNVYGEGTGYAAFNFSQVNINCKLNLSDPTDHNIVAKFA